MMSKQLTHTSGRHAQRAHNKLNILKHVLTFAISLTAIVCLLQKTLGGVGQNLTFEKNCPGCSWPQKPGILTENVYSDSKIRLS